MSAKSVSGQLSECPTVVTFQTRAGQSAAIMHTANHLLRTTTFRVKHHFSASQLSSTNGVGIGAATYPDREGVGAVPAVETRQRRQLRFLFKRETKTERLLIGDCAPPQLFRSQAKTLYSPNLIREKCMS